MIRWRHAAALTFTFAAFGCGLSSLPVWAASAPAVRFEPHRAVYEISLLRSSAGSGVTALNGRMVYELNGSSCEGFTQNMRFVTRMGNQEGTETLNDLRNSSWEDAASKSLRFSSSQYQNDALAESSQGDAKHGEGTASVALTAPAKKHVKLPADIYFPMQHASAVISAAKDGRTLLTANLYDGSEKGDKYYLTNTVIGKNNPDAARRVTAGLKEAPRLAALQSWPVAISYFDVGKEKQDTTPAYELAFRYFENGVTTDLSIDYGEFAIKGTLKDLTFLEPPKCATEQQH